MGKAACRVDSLDNMVGGFPQTPKAPNVWRVNVGSDPPGSSALYTSVGGRELATGTRRGENGRGGKRVGGV